MGVIPQSSRNFSEEVNNAWESYLNTGLQKRGITKEKLAEELEKSQTFIYSFFQGPYKRLGLFDTAQVCDALNLDVNKLLQIAGYRPEELESNGRYDLNDPRLQELDMLAPTVMSLPDEDYNSIINVLRGYLAGVTKSESSYRRRAQK
ncbi:helix-turn-helix domain-containing protein [Ktedonospora formicarum]|uniref:HTH cro/C1-type domain-containing protein n=1 Tax=Ktedonospora formicarum TaxID=2778364 RepID=A0A8J3HVG3_9CHLR|nr:helix-turn-helix transcriptional regulator [Ktedonospora formicarum]GHO44504.1 hypothetical protein KSX_26670 [Ktedonospora formicarum]